MAIHLEFNIPENHPIVKVEAILQSETNQVQIMVSDNGIGFEEKYLYLSNACIASKNIKALV
ncbi:MULTISPECIES: hypothetical protein [Okeania]|uniref:hypothetical protein n=1 Tax=Okeania TaxID=1458928 RepID=UPI001961DD3B|nr:MULTISPECIES: hypothetical protein [Okeania]